MDSCGVSNLGSHLLIAGINSTEIFNITDDDAEKTLAFLDDKFSNSDSAYIFSIAYDFGLKLENIKPRPKEFPGSTEPDVFLAAFDSLIVHDYNTNKTFLTGNEKRFDEIENELRRKRQTNFEIDIRETSCVSSNFTREEYIAAVEEIQERIRRGTTYQTNLTQQLRATLPENLTAQKIFWHLRKNHPAPFAAFLQREMDSVISISPERFFKVECQNTNDERIISTSPIKGTRPRGRTPETDSLLKNELLNSEKDLAENTMIVDLLRNDIGRICEYGTVKVEKLCDLETHATLFHLVSTINGELRRDVKFSDILRAVFPCGSITGAPKISTMRIIDELETTNRAVSMGAIGYKSGERRAESGESKNSILHSPLSALHSFDLSVAIRTMTVKNHEAVFNVGGGIVIDSVPEQEYEETLVKAKALLTAVNGKLKL